MGHAPYSPLIYYVLLPMYYVMTTVMIFGGEDDGYE